MSSSMNFMRLTGSKAEPSEACSELPSARPAVWRSSWSTVMAWRGSSGFVQAATGAGPSSFNLPWRTRMPVSAEITDFVMEKPSSGVSGPIPSA